ncbi:hypothetical protein GOP47_0027120 [Adiantum capillus-veneris]|nr:hypothetical protein GOP47_0027120 [Adiantum capillus-veneris]
MAKSSTILLTLIAIAGLLQQYSFGSDDDPTGNGAPVQYDECRCAAKIDQVCKVREHIVVTTTQHPMDPHAVNVNVTNGCDMCAALYIHLTCSDHRPDCEAHMGAVHLPFDTSVTAFAKTVVALNATTLADKCRWQCIDGA